MAGLSEDFTPHSLRHTAAAHWIAADVDMFKISRYLGHAKISTTFDLYGHLLPHDTDEYRESLDAMRDAAKAALAPESRAKVSCLRPERRKAK